MASSKHKTKTTHYYGCPHNDCKGADFEKSVIGEAKGTVYGTFTKDGKDEIDSIDGLTPHDFVNTSKVIIEPGYTCMTCDRSFDEPKLWVEEQKIACSHCGSTGTQTCTHCDGECIERA